MSFGGLITSRSNSATVISSTVADIIPQSNMPSPAISLPIKGKMRDHVDVSMTGENFDRSVIGRIRDEDYESRSGSDNFDAVSGDDQDAGEDQQPRRKKYHRHTPHQIQELENFFKECPHPDEKQRLALSRRLGLESKQIKFWFQNRRTQMKNQLERHENVILRQENEKLQTENDMLKGAMRTPVCIACGGPAVPGEITYEQQQLRTENARLKDELARICALTNKFLVGRNGGTGTSLPIGLDFVEGPLIKPVMGTDMMYERSMFVDLALAAMDELIKMADTDSPMWIKSLDGRKEMLKHDEYRSIFATDVGTKAGGFVTETSRETGLAIINSLALVETLMDANRWAEMFPSIISKASTIEVISNGTGGTRSGALQVMQAEFQVLSPLVPTRQAKFLRFCKQHSDDVWSVVDVSLHVNQEDPNYENCRRLPSGCIVQDMANGYSKVTWVEHSEYEENTVHLLYRPLLRSGLGLGAQRWIVSLQRQCESFATLLSATNPADDHTGLPQAGAKSILKLADRMMFSFYAGISASSVRKWDKLLIGNVSEEMRILTRKNLNDPGEPSGVVLSAATSVWMQVTKQRLFDFLSDRNTRSQWDVLSNGGLMQEMIHISKGQEEGNCVSLLRTNSSIDGNETSMLILQETWNDATGAIIVYAPVDVSSMNAVMNGGDSAYVALLPSGFAIVPDGSSSGHPSHSDSSGTLVKPEADWSTGGGGCLLTIGFQILVNSLPSAKLNVESVETVNNLISCTIQKIKAAIH